MHFHAGYCDPNTRDVVRLSKTLLVMEYQMHFHAGYCDPNTRDGVRLSETVKRTRAARQVLLLFESRATSQVFGSQYPTRKTNLVFVL